MSKLGHSYVRFFPSDWMAGTARMSRLHKSVYFDICVYNWDKNAAVPKGELVLMLADLPNGKQLLADLIAAGKVVRDRKGSVANPRAIEEAHHSFGLWQHKSEGGKLGSAKRWGAKRGNDRTPNRTPNAEPELEPEPDKESKKNPPTPFSPPRSQWAAFEAHRRSKGNPMTAQAVKLNLAKLEKLAGEGHDPAAVIEQSIMNGWTGLFRLKEDRDNGRRENRSRNRDAAESAFGPYGEWSDDQPF